MTTLTETAVYDGEFVRSEANGTRSREPVTIVSGQNLSAGTVVGKITASGKYAAYDNTANTGIEVAAGVLYADVDATAADKSGFIIDCDAEVIGSKLVWHANNDAAAKTAGKADLKALGIKVR